MMQRRPTDEEKVRKRELIAVIGGIAFFPAFLVIASIIKLNPLVYGGINLVAVVAYGLLVWSFVKDQKAINMACKKD